MQETRGSGKGCGDTFFEDDDTQQKNSCRRATVNTTQLPKPARGSGLDREHRLLSGVPPVCELGVFSCVVGCIRRESVCSGD